MKKSLIVTSLLMACVFIFFGCGNLSPGTTTIKGISFEPDAYVSKMAGASISSSIIANMKGAIVDVTIYDGNIEEVLQTIFPNGDLTKTENGYIYAPINGGSWEITESQWDEFEDSLDDIVLSIDEQDYEAEFDRQDATGKIEVELDPVITYPQTVTKVMIIDDTTGEIPTDSNLLKKVTDLIGNHFGSTAWENGSVDFDKTFSTEAEFENFEDNFEDRFDEEFTYNNKEYEIGLEEPFKNTLLIEVELEEDDDDDDD